MNSLPFNEEVVNRNKYGEWDLYKRDKYLGLIMPEGNLLGCPNGHGFSASRTSLDFFFNFLLEKKSKEDAIDYLNMLREKWTRSHHKDKLFMIPLIDWQINYAKNNFDLNSQFMKKYTKMCLHEHKGICGYWDTADYIVQLLNFDKVERVPQTITTARIHINERFYNYLLMDFKVQRCPAVVYNQEAGDFCYYRPNEFVTVGKERELEEEIKLIKKYVPLSDRPKYFR